MDQKFRRLRWEGYQAACAQAERYSFATEVKVSFKAQVAVSLEAEVSLEAKVSLETEAAVTVTEVPFEATVTVTGPASQVEIKKAEK
jgi:hypothetical protein